MSEFVKESEEQFPSSDSQQEMKNKESKPSDEDNCETDINRNYIKRTESKNRIDDLMLNFKNKIFEWDYYKDWKFWLPAILISIQIVVLAAILYKNTGLLSTLRVENSELARIRRFEEFLTQLKRKYPDQTNVFWANIKSSYYHSIVESKDPAVIILVGDTNTWTKTNQLALDILDGITSLETGYAAQNHHVIDAFDTLLQELNTDGNFSGYKTILDQKLIRIFSSGQKIALIKNMEQIPAEPMTLYYSYGDIQVNAKYAGVISLMTLNLNEPLDESVRVSLENSVAKLASYVENFLRNKWSHDLTDDKLRPLFTRIANNVILVK